MSPPRRAGSWTPSRPGDHDGPQHVGQRLGAAGPDQGYVLRLVRLFDDEIRLGDNEHRADVDAGCVAVALRRASLFGRAPIAHDLTVAYTIFGYLDPNPGEDLRQWRSDAFAALHHPGNYLRVRAVADAPHESVLRSTVADVAANYALGWSDLLVTTDLRS